MGDVFRFPFRFVQRLEWGRRMGIVTLVLALLFVIGWIRSLVTRDVLHIRKLNPIIYMASVNGVMCLERSSQIIQKGQIAPASTQVANDESRKYWEPWEIRWNWRRECCGFLVGSGVLSLPLDKIPPRERRWVTDKAIKDRLVEVWIVPYWAITIPLTLFSAFLLLTKPRKTTVRNVPGCPV